MTTTAETVSRDELRQRRSRLLARVGSSWSELQQKAEHFTLTDDERTVYDTVRGINWMLSRKP
ncbi:MAG TPA: hypothetical protein VHB69_08740 [Mycobacteriales bacterium]|nr:hypothetical protein [Mycobacteriales bacterium]